MSSEGMCVKVSPFALGLALGVMKGVCLLFLAYVSWLGGYGSVMVEHVASWYPGYGASFVGGIIGGIYGLIAGFISGFIFGYLYNFFLRCCGKYSS